MRKWVFILLAVLTMPSYADPYFGSAATDATGSKKSAVATASPPLSAQAYQQAVKQAGQQARDDLSQQIKQQIANQPKSTPGSSLAPSTQVNAGQDQNTAAPVTTSPATSNPTPQTPGYTGFPTQNPSGPTTQPSNDSGGWNVKY